MSDDNSDAVDDDRWVTVDPDDGDDGTGLAGDDEDDGELRVDPDAPGRSLFDDESDAVEPNEPG